MVAKKPLFAFPTLRATRKTVSLSHKYYGKAHHENGPENAFRHALWNYLIAKRCSEWSKNQSKVLEWTENITNWHEKAFRNTKLAEAMDLHNNYIGRKLFEQSPELTTEALLDELRHMTEASKLVTSADELDKLENNLVHIIP